MSEPRMTYTDAATLQGEIQAELQASIVDVRERADGGDGYYLYVKRLRLDDFGNVTYDPFLVYSREDWEAWQSERRTSLVWGLP